MMWSPAPLGMATSGSRTPSRLGLGPMALYSGDLCKALRPAEVPTSVVGPVPDAAGRQKRLQASAAGCSSTMSAVPQKRVQDCHARVPTQKRHHVTQLPK